MRYSLTWLTGRLLVLSQADDLLDLLRGDPWPPSDYPRMTQERELINRKGWGL